MNNEIEAQFLDIDKDELRVKLKKMGAKLMKPEVLMRRVVFDLGPNEELVWETAKKMGLKREKAKFGSVDTTYQHYYGVDPEVINQHTPKILFEMEPPEWARERKA